MNLILQGDALEQLKTLPSESIDLCVTSPPYYQLRDYGADGQIGLETTVEEYIGKLVAVFDEVRRVLKPSGTLWINISDSYDGSGKGGANYPENAAKYKQGKNRGSVTKKLPPTIVAGAKPKDLIGIPWLLAFALRARGWYWRQVEVWHKTNCMPESVRDRCTNAHEYILFFSKSKNYYFNYEAIMEPCVGFDKSAPRGSKGTFAPNSGRRKGNRKTFRGGGVYTNNQSFFNSSPAENKTHGNIPNESGLRRKRTVWNVPTASGDGCHFATFPPNLIEPCILAGSPLGGIVLDPFGGSGTVGRVALRNGREFVLIELNSDYIEIIKDRTKAVQMRL